MHMPTTPEETKLIQARYAKVVKANELIQKSRFSLTTQQQKIVLYLISKITPEDEAFKRYEFSVMEFCQCAGIDYKSGSSYASIKKAIKDLRDKSIWVKLPNGKETTVSWIEKAYIEQRSGLIEIKFDEDMKPWLLQLRGDYTQFELIYTLHFKSKYAIRLYEIIKSLHYDELKPYEWVYKVDELCQLLDAEKYSEQWMNFKARVLAPAIDEINKYSDKLVEYEPIKKKNSKKIERIRLYIKTKDTMEVLGIQKEIEQDLDQGWNNQTSLFDDKVDLLDSADGK